MSALALLRVLALAGVALPMAALAVMGTAALANRRLPDRVLGALLGVALWLSAACFLGCAVALGLGASNRELVSFSRWFNTGEAHFAAVLLVDPMSLGFALLVTSIAWVTSVFSRRYLRRDPGFQRYFVLFSAFVAGLLLVVMAGSIEVLFAGWELIGLSSALLVGFFHERAFPVRNAFRVFVVYRVSDAAMLAAAVLIHHYAGRVSLAALFGEPWTSHNSALTSEQATVVGTLLAVAACGKCAQLPFSGWLPRAMEGPTPSTAVFYGALSLHAGAFLLLRASPILDESLLARALVVGMGLGTALFASVTRQVQTDVKSALAFASLAQVSLILVEIGLGLRWLAFAHMVGHACLRLLQFLRAPSVLQDFLAAQSKDTGGRSVRSAPFQWLPERLRSALYRGALERGYLDATLDRFIVAPFVRLTRAADSVEQRWCGWLAGQSRREAREEARDAR